MLRSLALHDIPLNAWPGMERWYHRDHAPEIVRRYGPWLARFECYLPVQTPADPEAFGLYNWRMTEGWWRELPQTDGEGESCFTPPAVWPRVAACFIPPQPTHVFLGVDFLPLEAAPLRWLVLFSYPDGVSMAEGDEWFLGEHAAAVAALPGLLRFVGHRVVQGVGHVPGHWRPGTGPPEGRARTAWDWVLELWFKTFDDWQDAFANPGWVCRAPSWQTRHEYPFVEPFLNFASTFLLERPNDDFLRDLRAYVP